jgi:hypothetical protein
VGESVPRIGFSALFFALLLTAGGCLSNTSSASGDGGSVGEDGGGGTNSSGGATSSGGSSGSTTTTSSGGGSSGTSSGGSSGSSGGSGGSGGSSGTTVPITPDTGGYVSPSSNSIGIQGAWYAYGDCWGSDGAPPGACETSGMHPASACSSITFPPAATPADGGDAATAAPFTQTTPGTMCLSGTAAKVVGTDYSNMFGIGLGLDFNNVGGVKSAWAATTNNVTGFTFHLTGVPAGGIRVEFPTTDTTNDGSDSYAITATSDGTYTADLTTMAGDAHKLGLSFSPAPSGQPAFNANDLLSIQFHVATNITAAIPVSNLCVSDLAAIVGP